MNLGGIEAGGTKFVCAVGTSTGELVDEIVVPTTTPEETLSRVIAFFRSQARPLSALGIGSFGPLQLNRHRADYGFITSTPKEAWRYFDLLGTVRRALGGPVGFDTDVNAAALAEARWGVAENLSTFLYVTVGTGIGGALLIDGHPFHGAQHLEMGHIRVPRDRARDPFPGVCPYHQDCLEGLASGLAIEARWRISPPDLSRDHAAWILGSITSPLHAPTGSARSPRRGSYWGAA